MTHWETYIHRSHLPVPADVAMAWHLRPGAWERLLPPWEHLTPLDSAGPIVPQRQRSVMWRLGPWRQRWATYYTQVRPGHSYTDELSLGPLAGWRHTHVVEPIGVEECRWVDHVEYALPGGRLGRFLLAEDVHRRLVRWFTYRQRTATHDLAELQTLTRRFAQAHPGTSPVPQRIAVTGSSGLIGSALVTYLRAAGHTVVRLVRPGGVQVAAGSSATSDRATSGGEGGDETRPWDPMREALDPALLEGCTAVVHLAGENLMGRWTAAKKQRITASRVDTTRRLAAAMARMTNKPRVWVCASAIGIYGDQGDDTVDEDSPHGRDFLAGVAGQWESATQEAQAAGVRVVNLRLGTVLTPRGAALQGMMLPFLWGVGGPIGSGRQYWSWVALDDVLGAIAYALMDDRLHGPVNAVSPEPVTAAHFAHTLGVVLHRPSVIPMPAAVLRLLLGEVGGLAAMSQRIIPNRLQQVGYPFRHATLDDALRHMLGRTAGQFDA